MARPAKIPVRILEALKGGHAMTTEQLCKASGVHRTTVSAPARELQQKGLITITQKYVSSGNLMNVFKIAGAEADYAKTKAPQQSWISGLGMV